MPDTLTPAQRHTVMAAIHSSDTKPESALRHALWRKGFRYRVNDRRLPGSPDIVLPKYNTIVFVHGCFWHLHEGCKYATMPKSNVDYWKKKLYGNCERDERNRKELEKLGWKVITVWECELKKDRREQTLEELYARITSEL